MKKILHYFVFTVFFLMCFASFSAKKVSNVQKELKYEDLYNSILESGNNKKLAFSYTKKYLKKAKEEKNVDELFTGYSLAALYADISEREKYADSLITLAVQTKDDRYIGLAYSTSSSILLSSYNYSKSLENGLIAYEYFKNDNSKEYINSVRSLIGSIKYIIGDYENSRKIFEDVTAYFRWKKDNVQTFSNRNEFIYSLKSLIKVNATLRNFDENKKLIDEGYQFLAANTDMVTYKPGFMAADAFDKYSQGQFDVAVQKFKQALSLYKDTENHFYEQFYLGMCYWKTSEEDEAQFYFSKIREDYRKSGQISLEFRPVFEFFIEMEKKNGDRDKQLESVNELLKYDQRFKSDQKDVAEKLKTEYDEKRLLEEKENLLSAQKKERWSFIAIVILGITGGVAYYIYQNKRNKTQKIQEKINIENKPNADEVSNINTISENISITDNGINILQEEANKEPYIPDNNKAEEEVIVVKHGKSDDQSTKIDFEAYHPINKVTVRQILKNLDDFEKGNRYLSTDLRLVSLAEKFHTNEKYLSKVIRVRTGKTFNNYINDLRFKHLETELINNHDFKERKIKEIAKYLGFGTPEFFATAFKERYGKTPREYFEAL